MSLPRDIPSALQVSMPWQQSPRSLDSTHTSPSMQSTAVSPIHTLTISSLTGNYVHATIQVTRDLHPVFESLAERRGRGMQLVRNTAASDWPKILPQAMISLAQLMKILPIHLGLTLDLAYPTQGQVISIKRRLDLNQCTDAVLRTLHHTSASLGGPYARRRIAFTSFSPRVCAALNWKQPNCNYICLIREP
ncbi:hypothetical protein BV22DRAFT_12436 [Leucogyrophana mollusca]|uniref:Uncharacterized protein n=1 Tax=Leucogyrophana mollusca TaxID=85980 RepID=A0ACB8C1R7_9AGAM|nr:hypothetical protein BV22DRAFT_12436 [Leucogyrophana mollusca]